jgi:signal peptidase I
MIRLYKVTGESLSPFFMNGDFVMVAKVPFSRAFLKEGDIIAIRHRDYGVLIKKIENIYWSDGEIFVVGTNAGSVDSRSFGKINHKMIIGKVIWHIRKPS